MTNFSTFIQSGIFARFLATLFLFFIVIGAALIIGAQILSGASSLNPYAMALVGAGLSYSLTLLGIHLGNGNIQGASV